MNPRFYFFFISLFLVFTTNKPQEWVYPANKDVKTIYYQGMHASQTQAAKYLGSRGFISPTTLEYVVSNKSIDIVNDVWVKPEIDEVVPAPLNRKWSSVRALVPNMWAKAHELISKLANRFHGINVTRNLDSDPAQTIAAHSLIVSKINVAQEGDLANHVKRMESFYDECPDSDAIMMGVSRGAATTFQAAALYNKTASEKLEKVRLIHLEGCFDSVEHVMRCRHPWLLKSDFGMNLVAKCASWIIAFKKDGTSPIKMVNDFPQDIPVAFITSKKDREVPPICTKTLVRALLKTGHPHVYFLELNNSSHPNYASDNDQDKTDYQNFMHALYQKYGLPHIPDFAEAGKALLLNAKLTEDSQF